MAARSYIVDDREKKTFLLDREVLVSEDVLRKEMAQIFGRCWIYVGHASELKKPGDFRSRKVAGRPMIFCRDQQGEFHCLFNTCRHRGAIVCTEREGNRRRFQCIYHGWTYGNDGRLVGVPGDDAYAESFDKSTHGLRRPPRFEDYRGFWFMCLDQGAAPLADYLAGAKDYIDLVIDQSPTGRMEIIAGVQEYDVAANWKLMVENSVDDYHLPSTHSTWLNFMANSGVKIEPPKEEGLVLPTRGKAVELGNGHFTTDNINFRGRPVAKWIPLYGQAAKAEIDDIRGELVARLGAERAQRVADTNRNLVVFPNLVDQRRLVRDRAHVLSRRGRQDARHRLGARPGRGGRERPRAPARCIPDVLWSRRLRHARRRGGARAGAAGPRQLGRGPLVGNVARHGQGRRAAQQRRASPAHFLAALERADGSAGVTVATRNVVTRAEVEDFLYREAALLDDWKLDEWEALLTDDAAYYVPPNDQLEGDHRSTLFLVADDRERIRQRIIRIKIPTAMPSFRGPAPGA